MKQVSKQLFKFSSVQQQSASSNISYIKILNRLQKQEQPQEVKSEYLRSEHLNTLQQKKQQVNLQNIESLVGPSSRKSYFKHFEKSQPSVSYMTDLQSKKGLGIQPDGKYSPADFETKLKELLPEVVRQYHIYLRNDANFAVFENKDKVEELLKAKFDAENQDANVQFDFKTELEKMLSVKDRVFEKEYLKKKAKKTRRNL